MDFLNNIVLTIGKEVCHSMVDYTFQTNYGGREFHIDGKFWDVAGLVCGDLRVGYFENSKFFFTKLLELKMGEHVIPMRIIGDGDYYIMDDDLYFGFHPTKEELFLGLSGYRGVKLNTIKDVLDKL